MRALPLVALAVLLTVLVARSSLLALLPMPRGAAIPYVAVGIVSGLLPALLATRSPLPGALAIAVPALAIATYDQSRLDWLRLLRDFGVSHPGTPDVARFSLALAALLVAWLAHALDQAARLRWSALERGVAPHQAADAARLAVRRSTSVALLALVGTLAVGALALLFQPLDAGALFGGRAALLAPLLAVALIALAAVLVAGGRDEAAEVSRGRAETRR